MKMYQNSTVIWLLLLKKKRQNQEETPKQSASIIVSQSLQQNIESSEHNWGTHTEKQQYTQGQFLATVYWTWSHLLFKPNPKRRGGSVLCCFEAPSSMLKSGYVFFPEMESSVHDKRWNSLHKAGKRESNAAA